MSSAQSNLEKYSAPAGELLTLMKVEGIEWVVSVPDFVQLALHTLIEAPDSGLRSVFAANENQAIEIASGLHFGGKRVAVMMQNQGFYNCINSVRALGLDARVPLFLMIGQFGREFSTLGQDPNSSSRNIVNRLEPMLDLLDIPHWRVEGRDDVSMLSAAYKSCQERSRPSALLFGHYIAWS